MAGNELELVLRARDQLSQTMKDVGAETEKAKGAMDKLKDAAVPVGIAMTAIGAAGLKLVSDARKMNAELGQTALTMGATTEEMRELALATTNVTFPLDSVTKTFALLAKAGVDNTEQMKSVAAAFDALADATGSSAETMAGLLVPAFKLFGEDLPTTAEELDKFTFLAQKTTVGLDDFGNMLSYLAPDMQNLNITMDDAVLMLAALSEKGIEGSAATRIFRSAVTEAAKEGKDLTDVLGLSQGELDAMRVKMDEAAGSTKAYGDVASTQFGIMDKMKQKFSELTFQVGSLLTPLEPVLATMTALGPVLIAMPTLLKGLTAAQWLWNAALAANPIVLVVAAVAALTAAGLLLWKNWDTVLDFFKGLWIDMKITFAAGVGFIVNTVLMPFIEFWGKLIGGIAIGAGKLVGFFKKDLGESIQAVGQTLWNARQELTAWADDMAEGARTEKSIRATTKSLIDTAVAVEEVAIKTEKAAVTIPLATEKIAKGFQTVSEKTSLFEKNLFAINQAGPEFSRTMAAFQSMGFSLTEAFDLASLKVGQDFKQAVADVISEMENGETILAAWREGFISESAVLDLIVAQYGDLAAGVKAVTDAKEEARAREEAMAKAEADAKKAAKAAEKAMAEAEVVIQPFQAVGPRRPQWGTFTSFVQQFGPEEVARFEAALGGLVAAWGKIPSEAIMAAASSMTSEFLDIAMKHVRTFDTGGIVQGPGVFAVGPGVKEIVRTPGTGTGINITVNGPIYGLDDMESKIGAAIVRLRRRGVEV